MRAVLVVLVFEVEITAAVQVAVTLLPLAYVALQVAEEMRMRIACGAAGLGRWETRIRTAC